jgi:hypothetical protein
MMKKLPFLRMFKFSQIHIKKSKKMLIQHNGIHVIISFLKREPGFENG